MNQHRVEQTKLRETALRFKISCPKERLPASAPLSIFLLTGGLFLITERALLACDERLNYPASLSSFTN